MLDRNSKIYIAGHTGMVGSAIVRKFQQEGFRNLLLKTREELNLLDQKEVQSFFEQEKPDCVIVAAARVGGIKANMTYPAEFLYENLMIQNNIIWSAHEYGVQKLLFLGSSCIYPRECPQPMKEEYFMTGRLESTNEGYALAKIAGMKLCEYISKEFGKQFISCMPTNIYGEQDHFDTESSHVIPALIRRIHDAKVNGLSEVSIWGSGNSRREFLYVNDLADAVQWLLDHYGDHAFMNIGTGEDVSIRELAFTLKDIIGYTGEIVFDTSKPDGMPQKLLDVRILHERGWHHTTPLTLGLQKTYQWFLENYAQ